MERYQAQVRIQNRVMNALPKNFWDRTLHNFEPVSQDLKIAWETAAKYVAKKAWQIGINILFCGGYGTGKTHLAAGVVSEAIAKGSVGAFVTSTSLSGSIQEITQKFKELRSVELLAIDDVAGEQEHKIIMQQMFEMINYRYEAELGVVFTTNLAPRDFKDLMGERIWDRLAERTFICWIQDAKSYRERRREGYEEFMGL